MTEYALWLSTLVVVWYIVVGHIYTKNGNETHGLMYQLSGMVIAAMTAPAVWMKR